MFRAEALEEALKAGICPHKIDRLRAFLERIADRTVVDSGDLVRTYITPLKIKQNKAVKEDVADELVGVGFDATPHNGESFGVVTLTLHSGITLQQPVEY